MLGAVVAGIALPASAGAVGTGTVDSIALPGPANSVALAPDGSVWVSLSQNRTVARIAPGGTVSESADLGGATTGITVVEGKVWVAVTTAKKVVRFDPGSVEAPVPTTTPAGSCGPVAIAGLGNGTVVVSLPNEGGSLTCMPATPSQLLPVSAAGVAGVPLSGRGRAFDLTASGGYLWVPDNDGDVLRRVTSDAALTVTGTYGLPGGSGAAGIGTAPNGDIVVSLQNTNAVVRLAPTAAGGTNATEFATAIASPFGVGSVGNSLFVAGSATGGGSATIRRFPGDGSLALPIQPLAGAKPWDVSPGPDGTVLFTDLDNARLLRFTSRPPRAATGDVSENVGTSARVDLTANPGGNAAITTVEFGPTTAYGSTAVATPASPGVPVASGTADVGLRADLRDLTLGTTYHYRAVAVTAEGTAYGEDRTFTTPATPTAASAGPAGTPGAAARPKIAIRPSVKKGKLRIAKIRVTELTGGEKITVTCSGKGCPRKQKDRTFKVTAKKAGSLTVAAKKIMAATLGKGARVVVRVAKPGMTGAVTTVSVSRKNTLSVNEQCLAPGAKKPRAC